MKRLILLFLCVLVLFSLSSCAREETALLGRWEITISDEELGNVDLVYHFTEEGKIFLEQKDGDQIPFSIPFGTFSVDGENVTITSDGKTSVYHFLLEEDVLTLSSPEESDLVFHRV